MSKLSILARQPIDLGEHHFEVGDPIAEVELAAGVTHWYLADAIRNGFVGEAVTEPATKKKQAAKPKAEKK